MPKIIVTSRYMKSGSHAHIGNYVKYIGTREGVAVPEKNSVTTKTQTKLIEKLINDFPQSKELPEYEKYISQQNSQTASDCISAIIDDNMDLLASREIYMNYLGTRPNVVKVGSHGLFSESDEPIVLAKAAREVAEHSGTVWTHVVSLRRDDAERMGYTTLPMWRDLVKPIKNAVINTVLNMDFTLNTPDCELREQEDEFHNTVADEPIEIEDSEEQNEILPNRRYYMKWSKEYIILHQRKP